MGRQHDYASAYGNGAPSLKRLISLSSSSYAGSCLMTISLPRFTYLRLSVCATRTISSHDLWLFRCEYFVLVEEFCTVLGVLCNKLGKIIRRRLRRRRRAEAPSTVHAEAQSSGDTVAYDPQGYQQ